MKHVRFILLTCISLAYGLVMAQTPFDSFSPETSRPMLVMEDEVSMRQQHREALSDSMRYAVVVDLQQQAVYLADLSEEQILAIAPLTEEMRNWLSVDPLSDKYPNISPYAYCGWNPVMCTDPTGMWIAVVSNDDTGASYTVVGGAVDPKDCNVYIVGNDYDVKKNEKPRDAQVLSQTATPYSFCNERGNVVIGSLINMNDKSGDAFIARFQNNEIPLSRYVFDDPQKEGNLSGRNGGNCDFKHFGDVNRGMPLSILGGKIGTARDVGNFAAGYLAGVNGAPFLCTRIVFDYVQKGVEPPVSRSAQNLGYFTGIYYFLIRQNPYGVK